MTDQVRPSPAHIPAAPRPVSAADVDELLGRADRHPLGREFLLGGQIEAVAIMLHTDVYHVEAARERLARGR